MSRIQFSKRPGNGTYQEGIFHIEEGFFGPLPVIQMERARAILGGNTVEAGTQRECMLLLGVVPPSNDADRAFLAESVVRIQKFITDSKKVEAPPKPKKAATPEPVVEEDIVPEEAAGLGSVEEEKEAPVESPKSLVVSSLEEVEPPNGFECNYDEALKEMRESGYDYQGMFGLGARPKKADATKAYYAFKTGVVVG